MLGLGRKSQKGSRIPSPSSRDAAAGPAALAGGGGGRGASILDTAMPGASSPALGYASPFAAPGGGRSTAEDVSVQPGWGEEAGPGPGLSRRPSTGVLTPAGRCCCRVRVHCEPGVAVPAGCINDASSKCLPNPTPFCLAGPPAAEAPASGPRGSKMRSNILVAVRLRPLWCAAGLHALACARAATNSVRHAPCTQQLLVVLAAALAAQTAHTCIRMLRYMAARHPPTVVHTAQ